MSYVSHGANYNEWCTVDADGSRWEPWPYDKAHFPRCSRLSILILAGMNRCGGSHRAGQRGNVCQSSGLENG